MTNQFEQILEFKMTPSNIAYYNEFSILDTTKNIEWEVMAIEDIF